MTALTTGFALKTPEAPSTVAPPIKRGSDYSRLTRLVREAGLLRPRLGYYAVAIGLNAALFIGGWVAFFIIGQSWIILLVAVLMAISSAQLGFLGHEIGHRQVFRTRRVSNAVGLVVGNLAIGLGMGWWNDKHNRHHSRPNNVDHDPDVGPGALVWTPEQVADRRGIARVWARWQGRLFFPLLLLAGLNLHISSFRALPRLSRNQRAVEFSLLTIHFVAYFAALVLVLSPGQAIAFFLVHKCLFGLYLGSTFAPNHKGMPLLTGDDQYDYVRRQVLTSRNIKGSWFIDLAMGGLNYQIEHHLFPSMPRPALRDSQAIVEQFCRDNSISYCQTGLIESYRIATGHLDVVGNFDTARGERQPVS